MQAWQHRHDLTQVHCIADGRPEDEEGDAGIEKEGEGDEEEAEMKIGIDRWNLRVRHG
jgi:hypothetical protein